MAISKRYFKTRPFCTVTFRLEKDLAGAAGRAAVVGDFNDWSPSSAPMKRLKDGSFKADLKLEPGREYQFRYLLDDGQWQNDSAAEDYVPTPFYDAENSVVRI